jgi:methylmalonyl-CoA/ethylmalonyl-CoA epimerase
MTILTQTSSTLGSNPLSSMQIDHVCLNVPNYEETLQWYQEKLDATIEHEWTVGVFPDLKLAYLSVYGFRIEIIGSTQSQSGMPIATKCRSQQISMPKPAILQPGSQLT